MTVTILDRETNRLRLGPVFRPMRPGPERKLIDWFLKELPFTVPRGCNATVFCEPRLESGFPDLVVVFWSVAIARNWARDRAKLTKEDVRLVHYLYQTGPLTTAALRERLSRSVISNLERLEAAHLIRRVGGTWKTRALAKTFAARRIIAIEAKVSEWAIALNQAFQNTWFASDSYVLLPQGKPMEKIRSAAQSRGVHLCSPGRRLPVRRSALSNTLPRSYASWLFNEWAWRSAEL